MKLLLSSTGVQSRDSGSVCISPGRGSSNCQRNITLHYHQRCTSRETRPKHRVLSALSLETSLFLHLFGDLCLSPAGEEVFYDAWLEKRG